MYICICIYIYIIINRNNNDNNNNNNNNDTNNHNNCNNNNYYYVYYYTCTLTTHVRKQEFRSMTHPSQLTTHGCQIRFWCWLPLIQHLGFKHGGKSLNQMESNPCLSAGWSIWEWLKIINRPNENKNYVGPLVTNAWTCLNHTNLPQWFVQKWAILKMHELHRNIAGNIVLYPVQISTMGDFRRQLSQLLVVIFPLYISFFIFFPLCLSLHIYINIYIYISINFL